MFRSYGILYDASRGELPAECACSTWPNVCLISTDQRTKSVGNANRSHLFIYSALAVLSIILGAATHARSPPQFVFSLYPVAVPSSIGFRLAYRGRIQTGTRISSRASHDSTRFALPHYARPTIAAMIVNSHRDACVIDWYFRSIIFSLISCDHWCSLRHRETHVFWLSHGNCSIWRFHNLPNRYNNNNHNWSSPISSCHTIR